LDIASGGRRLAALPSSSIPRVPSTTIPAIRVVRKEERSMKAVSFISFDRSTRGAPLDRRLFSAEDANSSRTFSDLVEPSPNAVDL